jgi:hypothetical protein
VPRRRAARKTNEEIRRIVEGFEPSELTRAAYAELHGITVAALDGYRRRLCMRSGGFVEVAVSGEPSRETFAIALANGRRIEIHWADIERAAGRVVHPRAMIEALDGGQPCSD